MNDITWGLSLISIIGTVFNIRKAIPFKIPTRKPFCLFILAAINPPTKAPVDIDIKEILNTSISSKSKFLTTNAPINIIINEVITAEINP